MTDTRYLLSDEQVQHFLHHGYLPLQTQLPAEFHQAIYQKTEEVFGKEGNTGNNILPRIPALRRIFDDPVLSGALASLLGPNYLMHSHRHCHINSAGGKGGGWHKDSYWGFHKVRCHRTRWIMIFYYPQDVTLENGPTAVMPGTQFYEKRGPDEAAEVHLPVCGPAGTATLVHFDLWHRATPNQTDCNRYMMKFQFTRMEEPAVPTWNIRNPQWQPSGSRRVVDSALWQWHCGADPRLAAATGQSAEWIGPLRGGTPEERAAAADELGLRRAGEAAPTLVEALRDSAEPVRLNAAYALGAIGREAVPALIETLRGDSKEAQLGAAYALGMAGQVAVPALVEALRDPAEPVRGYAAYALGDMGARAGDGAVAALAALSRDPAVWVRRIVAEALGTVARHPEAAVPALIELLRDQDPQARYEAAYSLAHFGAAAASAVPALVAALEDDNRYVRNHSAEALRHIGTSQAQQLLMDFLLVSRWCPLTTKESTF